MGDSVDFGEDDFRSLDMNLDIDFDHQVFDNFFVEENGEDSVVYISENNDLQLNDFNFETVDVIQDGEQSLEQSIFDDIALEVEREESREEFPDMTSMLHLRTDWLKFNRPMRRESGWKNDDDTRKSLRKLKTTLVEDKTKQPAVKPRLSTNNVERSRTQQWNITSSSKKRVTRQMYRKEKMADWEEKMCRKYHCKPVSVVLKRLQNLKTKVPTQVSVQSKPLTDIELCKKFECKPLTIALTRINLVTSAARKSEPRTDEELRKKFRCKPLTVSLPRIDVVTPAACKVPLPYGRIDPLMIEKVLRRRHKNKPCSERFCGGNCRYGDEQ